MKLKYLTIAFISILFLSGCGNSGNKLTCSMLEEENGIKISETISVIFDNEKANSVEMGAKVQLVDKDLKNYWDSFIETFDDNFSNHKEENGIKLSINNDKKNYTYSVSVKADLAKVSEDSLYDFDLEDLYDSDYTFETLKEELEDSGFTCK